MREKTSTVESLVSSRMSSLAFLVVAFSVVSALVIGFIAYRHSLAETERQHDQFYLREARMLANLANTHQGDSEAEVLNMILHVWETIEEKSPDEYLCVVNQNSDLILHTARPDAVGNNVGRNRVTDMNGKQFCTLTELVISEQEYVGRYTSSVGQEQIAAFAPVPNRGWVLGLHRSRTIVARHVQTDLQFLKYSFLAICGLLMPTSLAMLYINFRLMRQRRRQAEATLDRSEARFKRLAENLPDMIYSMSVPDGRYEYVSPAAELLFGYSVQEFYDTPMLIHQVIHPDCREYFQAQWDALIEGDIAPTWEYQIRHKSGETRWLNQRNVLLRGEQGKPLAIEGVVSDVTERKLADERQRLLQEQVQAQEKHAAIGQLAAGIAHDFNNMLTGVMGYAELALINPDMPEDARRDVQVIQEQGQRASHLIRQILDFSRKSTMQKTLLDLLPFLKESIKLLQRIIPENIEIYLNVAPGSYLVEADATQLQQAVMNLAVNARDAMSNGGKLSIDLSQLEFAQDEITPLPGLMPPGHWILLCVSDTGTGMSKDIVSHIYEPFFTTKPKGEGTGLGLSQVYGIVKQHDGFIDVESKQGHGSTFFIYLPSREGIPTQPLSSTMPDLLPRGRAETILIVEDEPIVLDVIQKMLDKLGYQHLTAADGKEALEVYNAKGRQISLVLSDLMMPRMGGIELYGSLIQQDPSVKMIMMSGYPLSENNLPDNMQWVQKPPTLERLARAIHAALAHRSL